MTQQPERHVGYKRWFGDVPERDDFGSPIHDCFIDGVTVHGPWAIMSPDSHKQHGRGLGQGKGQKYQREGDIWFKVEG